MTPTSPLDPSGIAQFVEHDRCLRYLKQRVEPDDEESARNWKEAFTLMNSALIGAGREFEANTIEALAENAALVIGPELADPTAADVPDISVDETWADSTRGRRQQLQAAVETAADYTDTADEIPYVLLYQAPLGGTIGAHDVYGNADCIALTPIAYVQDTDDHRETTAESAVEPAIDPGAGQSAEIDSDVVARVIDGKSAHDQQPGHRIQVTIYCLLLERILAEESGDTPPACHIEGGVLTREVAAETPLTTPFVVPPFAYDAWALVVNQLLAADGPVSTALEADLDELPYALNQVCNNCAYKEACATRAVEAPTATQSLALLGEDAGVQRTLREAGIESLRELATLAPPIIDPSPTDERPALSLAPPTRQALEAASPEPVAQLIQRAQVLYSGVDPEYDGPTQPQPIPGTGWVQMPDDRQTGWGNVDTAAPGELINIALIVRPDPTVDRVAAVGAAVSAKTVDEVRTVTELSAAVPAAEQQATISERQLLDRFTDTLFETIETVAQTVGDPEHAVIHCYTYSEHEQDTLVAALDRHADDHERIRALRALCSLNPDGHTPVDQAMWTAVQPVVNEHFALQYPSQGLLQVAEQFIPGWTTGTFDPLDGRADAPPLRAIFREQFLSDSVPYLQQSPGVRLHLAPGRLADGPAAAVADTTDDQPSPDGWYPIRKRAGTQFPIEYLWAVTPQTPDDDTPRLTPEIVDEWALDDEAEPLYRQEIERYYYRTENKTEPLRRADLTYLLERLSETLLRLIDAVPYKDTYIDKTPINATTLSQFTCPSLGVAGAIQDYLQMEHGQQRDEILARYRQPLRARVRSGYAVPVRCTEIESTDGDGLQVSAELAYDTLVTEEQAETLAARARISAGAWRVLTGLQASETAGTGASASGQPQCAIDDPTTIKHSPPVIIESIDYTAQTLTLTLLPHRLQQPDWRQYNTDKYTYRVDHCGWASPVASNVDDPETVAAEYPPAVGGRTPVWIEPGEEFILDQMIDDFTAPKAERAVQHGTLQQNALWQHLEAIAQTGQQAPVQIVPDDEIGAFLDHVADSEHDTTPTPDQQAFIRAVDRPIVPLQGPAGAGKTSGAIAPALLARAYARRQTGQPFTAFVVAPSHEAVDNALEKTIEWLQAWHDTTADTVTPDLIRVQPTDTDVTGTAENTVTASDSDAEPGRDTVTHCAYTTDEGSVQLAQIADDLVATVGTTDGPPTQQLLFVTPTTLYRVLERVAETTDAIDGDTAAAAMHYSPGVADVVCLDEASMIDLPQLFLATSALAPAGQTLIVGDHRQLSTITAVDWEDTSRKSVTETHAYLSALDYVRWVNDYDGESIQLLPTTTNTDATDPTAATEGVNDDS